MNVTCHDLDRFRDHLLRAERSAATVNKYTRDVKTFLVFAGSRELDKSLTVAYKEHLCRRGYSLRTVNSMLAALNSLMTFLERYDCRVKSLKCQRMVYRAAEKELTREEYLRLLEAARGRPRLRLVLQTICATGIRVSELRYFTVEGVKRGEVAVRCKSKTRTILVPGQLKGLLLRYARDRGIRAGAIFVTAGGRPLDRSNIWAQMKSLCRRAGVSPAKVFPHNLRRLFARAFYSAEKDIAALADILGHGSIETTRIYIMTTEAEHRRKLERLGLVLRI